MRVFLLVFLSFSLFSPAFASDGVLEINQTCATLMGCFPGDSAGFPVTITKSGSYRSNTDAGIRSIGSVISDNTVSDSGGDGIEGAGSIIRNNYVSGSGGDGISGGASIVSDNKVSSNGGYGIRVGGGSIVSDNIVRLNDASGIYNDFPESEGNNPVDFGTIIRGNNVQSNTGYGLELSYVTTYRDNMITGNTVGPVKKGTNLGGNHCTGTGTIAFTCP